MDIVKDPYAYFSTPVDHPLRTGDEDTPLLYLQDTGTAKHADKGNAADDTQQNIKLTLAVSHCI